MGAFLSLSTSASTFMVPPTLSASPLLHEGRETRRRTGLFKLSLPFIHFIFLHALCLLYTLARATVFCVAQRPDNDGGTLCKIFNVLPFRLPFTSFGEPHGLFAIPSFHAFLSFSRSFLFTPFSCESMFVLSCTLYTNYY